MNLRYQCGHSTLIPMAEVVWMKMFRLSLLLWFYILDWVESQPFSCPTAHRELKQHWWTSHTYPEHIPFSGSNCITGDSNAGGESTETKGLLAKDQVFDRRLIEYSYVWFITAGGTLTRALTVQRWWRVHSLWRRTAWFKSCCTAFRLCQDCLDNRGLPMAEWTAVKLRKHCL